MKKLIALLLALVCVLSVCAGCGGGGALNQGGEVVQDNPDELVKLTVGIPSNALVASYKDNALTKYLEAEMNVEIEFVEYSGGSEIGTQIATNVTAGEALPDILWGITLGDGVINRYGKDGYFRDLAPYFQDKEGASKVFWERIEANLTDLEIENVKRQLVNADTGGIYAIPSMETSLVDIIDYQVWINTEWLDALGLEMPTDIDSLYDTLVAFKTRDPNGNGKNDEIPLYGSETGGLGADVINYLVNLYLYFNDRKPFNVDDNGKLYVPYTTDEYREAMIFINKLYKEKLINDAIFATSMQDLQKVTTPASGTAMAGIFCGHLTLHATKNSAVLDQYQPLPYLEDQTIVFNDNTFRRNIFITQDCANPDRAFALIMKMWEEETSYRIRYGEFGANWTWADEGAVSDCGIPAKIKILNDPFAQPNACLWADASGTLNVYAEGEAAQMGEDSTAWEKRKSALHAQSRVNADEAAAANNPVNICPTLTYTDDESELISAAVSACSDYMKKSRTDFIKGKMDPNNDAVWNQYVGRIEELGVKDWLAAAQKAYDRGTKM